MFIVHGGLSEEPMTIADINDIEVRQLNACRASSRLTPHAVTRRSVDVTTNLSETQSMMSYSKTCYGATQWYACGRVGGVL